MDRIALASYVMASFSSAVSFGAFMFLYATYRRPVLKSYLLYMGAYSAQLASSLVGQAMFLGRPMGPEAVPWLQLPGLLVLGALVVVVPRFYFDFSDTALPAGMRAVFRVMALLTVVLAPLSLVPPRYAAIRYIPSMIGFLGFMAAMIYSQVTLIRAYPRLRERLFRIGVPALVAWNIVCVIGGTLDSLFSQSQIAAGSYPHGMLFQPVMYTLWNALTFAWAVRSHGSGIFRVQGARDIDVGRSRALGLSDREIDLARLLARGAANKEIADALGISPNTVRNHVYNIFRKTGARNRVELTRTLTSGGGD